MSDRRPERAPPAALTLLRDLARAFRFVVGTGPPDSLGAWAVYLPLVGLMLGGLWLATDLAVGQIGARAAASLAVILVHAAVTRARPLMALGSMLVALAAPRPRQLALLTGAPTAMTRAAALAVAAAELWLLCELDRFRPVGLVFAPLLGCCSMVVLAVGSRAARADGRRLKYAPEVQFREFGLASTATFVLIFLSTEFLGLLLILATAAFTVAARVFLHRWIDGVNAPALRAVSEATQILVLAVLAAW